MKYLLTIIITCLSFYLPKAQIINIDKTDTSDYVKKALWNGNIAAGLEVDKQYHTIFDMSNFADVSLQKNRELVILSASNRFTNDGSQDFLNTGYAHIRWRYDYKEQLHPETYTQYQWDDLRGMKHRFVSGVNLRYNFWHRQAWEMTFATGLFYENERWDYIAVDSSKIPPNPVDQQVSHVKLNSYIKWQGKPSPISDLSIIIFYQTTFKRFFEPRISAAVDFDINISRHFAFDVRYNGLYDSRPVVPIFNFYYSFSNSLQYKF